MPSDSTVIFTLKIASSSSANDRYSFASLPMSEDFTRESPLFSMRLSMSDQSLYGQEDRLGFTSSSSGSTPSVSTMAWATSIASSRTSSRSTSVLSKMPGIVTSVSRLRQLLTLILSGPSVQKRSMMPFTSMRSFSSAHGLMTPPVSTCG